MESETELVQGRLDQYVAAQLPELSRSSAAKLIEQKAVAVNGSPQTKPGYRLRPNDKVSIDYSPAADLIPDIDLTIVYEDDDCVVISKPTGVLSHSKGVFNPEGTVASWLAPRLQGLEPNERAGIVHRLDRGTSGVMICAKTPTAVAWLQKQFSQRRVKKTYQAVVEGQLDVKEAVIDMPIERHPKRPQTFRAGHGGKPASTHYKVLIAAANGETSLLELKPVTGRTHQLRVHLGQIGHPIIGDTLYGGRSAPRMLLHAAELELTLPSRQRKTFKVPVPEEFRKCLNA